MSDLRRKLLKLMLWCLAIAAVLGALTILTGTMHNAWRVVSTALITAAAAGLMIPTSFMLDKTASRNAGLLGMVVILCEFGMGMAETWLSLDLWRADFEEKVWLTMLFLFFVTPPAMFYLKIKEHPRGRIAGWTGVATAAAVLMLLLMGAWSGRNFWAWNSFQDHCIGTGSALAGFGVLATASLAGWVRGDRRHWRWLGVLASGVGLCIATFAIWYDLHEGSVLFNAIIALACVVGYANLTLLVPLNPGQAWIRVVAVIAANVAAWLWVGMTWMGKDFYLWQDEDLGWLARGAGAAAFVVGCCTLAMVILYRFNRRPDLEGPDAALTQINMECPRCHKKQTLPVGEARCSGCQLRIFTRIEEPTCPKCGYLLYKLTGELCPECGTRISDQPLSAMA